MKNSYRYTYSNKSNVAKDLNKLKISNADGDDEPFSNTNTKSRSGEVQVFFRDIESELITRIQKAQLVVGCVAWLTNPQILKALSKVKSGVAVVVQKEDFLRPDMDSNNNWQKDLRKMYDGLPQVPDRFLWTGLIGKLSICTDPLIQPVRCVGNHNRDKNPAFPRMHNKFLIFCECEEFDTGNGWIADVKPYQVWTGSFNFTKTAGKSLENAVVISDTDIVDAYFQEWEQIEAISEPLDWETDWIAPEWRIGT